MKKMSVKYKKEVEKSNFYIIKTFYGIRQAPGLYEITVYIFNKNGRYTLAEDRVYALKRWKIVKRLTGNEIYPEDDGHEKLDTVLVNLYESYTTGIKNSLYVNYKFRTREEVERNFKTEKIKRFDDIQQWDSLYDVTHKRGL